MDSLNIDDIQQGRDPKHLLLELFPEDAEALTEKRALEVFEYIKPHLEEYLNEVREEYEQVTSLTKNYELEQGDLKNKVESVLKKIGMLSKFSAALVELGDRIKSNRSEILEYVESSSKASKEIAYRALGLVNELSPKIPEIMGEIENVRALIKEPTKPYDDDEVWKELEDLRKLILSRPVGGGGAYRNIAVQGNTSVLSRYNDLNIKAGANVTLTYLNNNTTKFTDLTISAIGGGGGGGLSRSINSISTSQTAGSTSATDYVYLCTGTITLTMPDATAGNTNLYTIKNVGSGTVTINTTSSQTIDGSLTITLPVQYTSVDLESDTANWNVT